MCVGCKKLAEAMVIALQERDERLDDERLSLVKALTERLATVEQKRARERDVTCEGTCNPCAAAECGALFCTEEDLNFHMRSCPKALPPPKVTT